MNYPELNNPSQKCICGLDLVTDYDGDQEWTYCPVCEGVA